MPKGKFIVLEGGEGAGKGTIRAFLEREFPAAVFTRDPGGTPIGEKIRVVMLGPEATGASAETHFGLIWASRFENVHAKIAPALEAGKVVIAERFDSSTYAYQLFGQEALHLKPLFFACRKLLGDVVPDLYIFLDVDAKMGVERVSKNEKKEEPLDHFEKRPLDFHERVREGYKEFFREVPHVVVDANRPLEEVQRAVLELVKKQLQS